MLTTRFGEPDADIWIKFCANTDWKSKRFTIGAMSLSAENRRNRAKNRWANWSKRSQSKNLTLGLATDGDGDRFGVIDSNGAFITPNELIALLADYLAESRGWTEGLARSVATSHLIDRVAESRGLKLYETPVGFKYIGELINKDEIILGGEESAGLSIKGHYPEKDGIFACLLAAEAVAVRGVKFN